jgi:putative ABC transport system permease protein
MLRNSPWRAAGTITGIALAIGLIALLGAFLRVSGASMTIRAASSVPVDWQVELLPGADVRTVEGALDQAARIARREEVGYASVGGLEATTGDTVQVTGPGKVLGINRSYVGTFPAQIRVLHGIPDGVMIAQQTAANLHVGVGDQVTIHRPDLPPETVTISGVVDLPDADAMFQAIGVPPGSAPQAPPDNVMILPLPQWRAIFAPEGTPSRDDIRWQIHASLDRAGLPESPLDAFRSATIEGHNLGLRVSGQAMLGNNLAARLDAVREDALYARILFLFLGAPGVVLAGLLTVAVTFAGKDQRRHHQTILRLRGASRGMLLRLAAAEALALWLAAAVFATVAADVLSRALLGTTLLRAGSLSALSLGIVTGLALALGAVVVPAWLDARSLTVARARQMATPERNSLWRVVRLDFILLSLSALIFWRTASSGYQVVLAPEGVSAAATDNWAFLSPLLFWVGIGLLTLRLTFHFVDRSRSFIRWVLRPLVTGLSGVVAASLSRQRRRLAMGIGLTTLAFAFAASTAIFNATYQHQAIVDAQLTNGADVTVTGDQATPAGAALGLVSALPGIVAVQPMQHRYAYVGDDLQDLYGIDPRHIGDATEMSNAYFASNDAHQALAALAASPNGILVSEETVSDFQLSPGDQINLRIKNAASQKFESVPFTLIGVVREFPTAPRDSFLVANASYLAAKTASAAAETLLIRTSADPAAVHRGAEAVLAGMTPGLRVSDVGEAAHLIGSSLTAVNLHGLTQIELGFAVLAVIASTGLFLGVGLADRRRGFAILALLGATPRQTAGFLWAEGVFTFALGSIIGTATGAVIAWMLVNVLQGAFDPPPERLLVPWAYLLGTLIAALLAAVVATEAVRRDVTSEPLMTIKQMR